MSQSNIINTLSEAIKYLARRPEYLLLFAVVVLFSLYPRTLPEISIIFFAIIVVIFIVVQAERGNREISQVQKSILEIKENILLSKRLSQENGITNIYSNRKEFYEKMIEDLRRRFQERRKLKIQIIGISLRDFFVQDHRIKYESLMKLIEDCLEGNLLTIQALVLNTSNSEQADIRVKSDCGLGGGRSALFEDLKAVSDYYYTFCNQKWRKENLIQIKTYKASASCFMLVFNDEYVVVEQYHSGGFGGQIPVIQYSLQSATGNKFSEHFYFLWNDDSTETIQPNKPTAPKQH
ncbi:MAG: hypothetical protein ACKPI6_12970 [Microcystis panniformis]